MKKFIAQLGIIFLFIGLSTTSIWAQITFSDPVTYNDYIVGNQDEIGEGLINFMNLFTDGAEKARFEEVHLGLIETIETAITEVKAMPAYEGNLRLKDASVNLFVFYKSVVEKEYKELMNIYIAGNFNEETSKKMDGLISSITTREENFDKEFGEAQAEFAKKYNFSLEENDLQKEFENDGE